MLLALISSKGHVTTMEEAADLSCNQRLSCVDRKKREGSGHLKREFKVLRHMPLGNEGTKATLYTFDNFVGAPSRKKHLSLHYVWSTQSTYVTL